MGGSEGKIMTPYQLNFRKTLQAVGVLLKEATNRTAPYLRILKLMYMADRISLREKGRSITQDQPFAMKYGPVLSRTFDLIKGTDPKTPEWSRFVERRNYEVQLVNDPGIGDLCRYEIQLLQKVWTDHLSQNDFDLVEETHQFEEWKKNDPGDSSQPIPVEDILKAVGKNREEIRQIEADWKQEEANRRFFEVQPS
jgi:uncharacterized phage-associated protein